jgi:hypothetical protein
MIVFCILAAAIYMHQRNQHNSPTDSGDPDTFLMQISWYRYFECVSQRLLFEACYLILSLAPLDNHGATEVVGISRFSNFIFKPRG